MAKKKNNPRVINNIQELNLEIDYDKLAEAINKTNSKPQDTYSPSREWMKLVLIPVFWGVAIFIIILTIAMVVSTFKNAMIVFDNWNLNRFTVLIFELVFVFFGAGFGIITIIAAKEIDKENDRNYVASIFSNIVAIAALIISLIALLKEVR